jgi:ADP-heptose:LPS heptosyltransferase
MPVIPTQNLRKRIEKTRPPSAKRDLTLGEFYEKRNKIIVIRGVGGLGDVLMHRMMFEDFKLLAPDIEISFACPPMYHDAVKDHPFVDHVLHVEHYNRQDYLASYVTTTACGRYEMKMAPYSGLHRSDIWAQHCGIALTKHDMHIQLTEKEKQEGRRLIEKYRDRSGPSVVVAPISAIHPKDLLEHQLMGLTKGLHERGCYVFGLHTKPIYPFLKNDVPVISGVNLRQWLAIINQADYTISVDSAAFHAAGGMGKPLVGIFTFADGEIYGRYFDFFLVQRHRNLDPNWTCGPCYNWGSCHTKNNPKPCLTGITAEDILQKADLMFEKWPI